MWFPLALTAMLMLVVRRGSEKTLSGHIPATSMAWLQQVYALPFMAALLPFATVYSPLALSEQFYWILLAYVVLGAVDLILYFKAIAVGDISVVSSVLSLLIVSMMIGSYFILGQVPTALGLVASVCVMAGAYLASKKPPSFDAVRSRANRIAILLMLSVVTLRGIYGPLEVLALRETNALYFNFVTSVLMIPLIMLIVYLWSRRRGAGGLLTKDVRRTMRVHRWGLILIGVTYTVNLTCTFAAYLAADNAAYVTAIKAAQVLPMVLLGVFFFKEKVHARQWVGLGVILTGLLLFSQT